MTRRSARWWTDARKSGQGMRRWGNGSDRIKHGVRDGCDSEVCRKYVSAGLCAHRESCEPSGGAQHHVHRRHSPTLSLTARISAQLIRQCLHRAREAGGHATVRVWANHSNAWGARAPFISFATVACVQRLHSVDLTATNAIDFASPFTAGPATNVRIKHWPVKRGQLAHGVCECAMAVTAPPHGRACDEVPVHVCVRRHRPVRVFGLPAIGTG